MSKSVANRSIEQNIVNRDSHIDTDQHTTLTSTAAVRPSISFSNANIDQILTPGREKWRSGKSANFSLSPTSKNNCGFEAISLALLRLPHERGVRQRLGELGKALAKSADHEGLDERERGELHELASELLACHDELNELRELVTSALLDTALPLEPASRDLVRSLLADASTPTGARFARLVRLLRLVAAAAVYMQQSETHLASDRRGRKPGLPPAVVDAKTEGRRVSGEVLHALLDRLGYRALLLLTCAAAPNGPHRIRLGPTAADAPFIGTIGLGLEEAHYQLILATAVAPRVAAKATKYAASGGRAEAGGGAAHGAVDGGRRHKCAIDMERKLQRDARVEDRRDEACQILAKMHNLGPSQELLPWARGGGREAKGRASSSASPSASDESSTGPDGRARRVRQCVREHRAPGAHTTPKAQDLSGTPPTAALLRPWSTKILPLVLSRTKTSFWAKLLRTSPRTSSVPLLMSIARRPVFRPSAPAVATRTVPLSIRTPEVKEFWSFCSHRVVP